MAAAVAVVVVCLSILFLPLHRCELLPAVQTVELDRSGSTASATSECGRDLIGQFRRERERESYAFCLESWFINTHK